MVNQFVMTTVYIFVSMTSTYEQWFDYCLTPWEVSSFSAISWR